MTENEAKYTIIEYRPIVGFQKYRKALDIAIQALEEIQQYRAIQKMIGIPLEDFAKLCDEKIPGECKNPQKAVILTDEDVDKWEAYKSIGTVEELKSMKENGAFSGVELAQLAAMQMRLRNYQTIGTIEEFKALKEKSVAKKPLLRLCGDCQRGCVDCDRYEDRCPTCNGGLYVESGKPHEHCPHCGQKLDWE